ncbi:MAG: helix-turn-helix transcriptional regulator [Dorea sp.]|nr:helix-turn-helix transcriptional regulator [Dorea sp.]
MQITEIPRLCSMHPTYLSAMFRKEYQISPKRYIIQKRIETAVQLLHTTDLTIKQISSFVGYANQMEFAQLFKKYTGKSPAEYRQSSNT